MTIKKLNLQATNTDGIKSYSFSGGYDGGAYTATIICTSHSLNIGDYVSVNLWYSGNVIENVFSGYVKQITRSIPDGIYTINLYDVLIRAVDYFIASSNPDNAYKIKNISAEALVGDILNMAGITNYGYEATNFIFGVNGEGELNLTGAYDYIHGIADLLAWHVYADKSGKVWFVNRKPYVMDTDVAENTINEVIKINGYSISDRDLRNRVVIYGKGVYAEASASSPYLPSGFYKSVVLSSPHIDSQTYAQRAADYNLDKLNRLTYEASITIEGNEKLYPLQVINLNLSSEYDFINGDWLIYQMETRVSDAGFIQDLILRR